ncbi:MAG: family 16 glycoside hydrolase [Bryobacteraceae bacterium]
MSTRKENEPLTRLERLAGPARWVNDELIQDLKLDSHPELSRRLRSGYIGLTTLGYPLRFRNLKVRELPPKLSWVTLYGSSSDLPKWFVSESKKSAPVRFEPYGAVLRADGLGHIATKELYRDFELQLYIRGAQHHNGGVLFRSAGKGLEDPRRYEIQLHDVPEAHFPTGSLYFHKRSRYLHIEPEKWFLLQLAAKGKHCWVRIDGETVLEHDELKDVEPGHIELQAHQAGRWLEFKQVLLRPL